MASVFLGFPLKPPKQGVPIRETISPPCFVTSLLALLWFPLPCRQSNRSPMSPKSSTHLNLGQQYVPNTVFAWQMETSTTGSPYTFDPYPFVGQNQWYHFGVEIGAPPISGFLLGIDSDVHWGYPSNGTQAQLAKEGYDEAAQAARDRRAMWKARGGGGGTAGGRSGGRHQTVDSQQNVAVAETKYTQTGQVSGCKWKQDQHLRGS